MNRLDELTGKFLDGTLTVTEAGELDALLASDPAVAADHVALLELEAALRGLRTDFDLAVPTLEQIQAIQAEKTAQAVLAEIATSPAPDWASREHPTATPPRSRRWGFAIAGFVAISAALLIGVWLGTAPTDPQSPRQSHPFTAPQAVARLTQSFGSVELLTPTGEVSTVTAGHEVPAGYTLRTIGDDSLAQVELPDHTKVDIEPGSVVRFVRVTADGEAEPRLFLAAGQLTAAMPERMREHPLIVGTGVGEVQARNGTFVVASAGPESARVDLKEGDVEVVRMDTPSRYPLTTGGVFFQAGLSKFVTEPSLRIDYTPTRELFFTGAKDAIFSSDDTEIWVASGKKFTRWTTDGGTADMEFAERRGRDGYAAAFTHDRRTLITDPDPHTNQPVFVRSVPSGDERATLKMRLPERHHWTVAPDADWLALRDGKRKSRQVRVLDCETGRKRYTREFEDNVGPLAASPDGTLLAVGLVDLGRGENNKVHLLDPTRGDRVATLPTQKKALTALAFSDDSTHLAAGFNGQVQLWDVEARELVKVMTGFERVVTSLAFSPARQLIACGTQDGQVWIWSLASGQPVQRVEVGTRGVRSLAFNSAGTQLVTTASGTTVRVWDVVSIPTTQKPLD